MIIDANKKCVNINGKNIPWLKHNEIFKNNLIVNNYMIEELIKEDQIGIPFIECKDQLNKLILDRINLVNNVPGFAKNYVHKLEVDDKAPFHVKNYPIPFAYRKQVKKGIEGLLQDQSCEFSVTSYVNPSVVVRIFSNTFRLKQRLFINLGILKGQNSKDKRYFGNYFGQLKILIEKGFYSKIQKANAYIW